MNRRHFACLLGAAPLLAQTPAPASPVKPTEPPPPPELDWHDAKSLTVEGLGFHDLKSPYDRLPGRAENVVRKEVWNLSRDASGELLRFTANARTLHARWSLTTRNLAATNMTAISASGLDLYAKTDAGRWRWLGIGRPTKFPDNEDTLISSLPPGPREYMLYLPLRNGITSLEIGVDKDATITRGPARAAGSKPLVFYGTSITHGIGASRPGMTHPALLGRMFDREIINLGFSGNGRMEPEVAKFLAELDPAVFILDCLPNIGPKEVTERTGVCVSILREAHPATPILLVEDRNYPDGWLIASRRQHNEDNHAALRAVYAKLQAGKVPNIYYLKADDMLGDDGDATVDGSHPTDLGFARHAAEFAKVLKPIL